jgi:hypothetical protein
MDLTLLRNHTKNMPGWWSKRKIVCFAVDDYGNVRLASTKALEAIERKGIRLHGRYDRFDALDTRQDYEQLFDVLQSVKDSRGRPAIFTTYALSCNADYQSTVEKNEFIPQQLDKTYELLSAEDPIAFEGAFDLLHEGIAQGFIKPQFHGREHININVFNALLADKHPILRANLEYQCLTGMPGHVNYPNVRISEAFAYWQEAEIARHKEILKDGLYCFEKVYGYPAQTFTPPAMHLHPSLYDFMANHGIRAIEKPRQHEVHMGEGVYQKERNVTGSKSGQNYVTIVRNCLFEPNSSTIDWVNTTYNQIKAAFFWKKSAIISSHRVNFCGHIDPSNREKGLAQLRLLLRKIVQTWPDVEFMSIDELAAEIHKQ